MLHDRTIEDSTNPYSSHIVVELKPDGSLRVCNDFWRLNQVFEFDSYSKTSWGWQGITKTISPSHKLAGAKEPRLPFTLHMDASETGLGIILENDTILKSVEFFFFCSYLRLFVYTSC